MPSCWGFVQQSPIQVNQIPANWPFPIVDGVRTPESQALIDAKRLPSNVEQQRKEDLAQMEEALF